VNNLLPATITNFSDLLLPVSILAKQYMYKQYKTVPFPQAMQQQRTVNGDRKEIEQTPTMFLVQSQRVGWGTRFELRNQKSGLRNCYHSPSRVLLAQHTTPFTPSTIHNTNPSLAVSRFPGSKQCFPPQIPGLLPLKSRLEKGAAVQNNHQIKRDHLSWDFRQRGTAT
jgi:hypothetical protein